MIVDEYGSRVESEIRNYADVVKVHDLPPIFHYNSNRYWRPLFRHFGFESVNDFYLSSLREALSRSGSRTCRILSVGSGNCDTEVALAGALAGEGRTDFVMSCLDLNPHMLERGKALAEEAGVSERMEFVLTDVNGWRTGERYDLVMANQSLHHFLELELLFGKIRESLQPDGRFVTSDMIGRNGHMRWPEALGYIEALWRRLGPRHKYNHQLRRHEEQYENWDCSKGSFEGIRAQDILPLLIRDFHFELFLGFGNLIDIFVDRGFGHNFDPDDVGDCRFIDFVAELDELLIESGRITPTHMIASMTAEPSAACRTWKHLTPEFCVRWPDAADPMEKESSKEEPPPSEKGTVTAAFPDGHFYSPVVDASELAPMKPRLWPAEAPAAAGVDFNERSHLEMLAGVVPVHLGQYDYPQDLPPGAPPHRFHSGNTQFGWLDSRMLFVMLRQTRPKRMIEVGSGFSSLLTADVNQRFMGGALDFTCIEPYPREFLRTCVPGITRLIEQKVQDVPLSEFDRLGAGDILFVDSSHVSKTGSDVNTIFFEILPRLHEGVLVHFHDIFLPAEYPEHWVLEQGRSWNEQYLLRALLMYSNAFEVVFGCSYALHRFPDLLRDVLRGECYGGGSFWMRKRHTAWVEIA